MKARHQVENLIDRLNVTLDQVRADQEEASANASTMQYQSYAELYERLERAQGEIRTPLRDFDRAQSKGARNK